MNPTGVVVEKRPDGTILVRSPHSLGPYPEKITERLDYWARHASYRTFLAERDAHGRWRNVTYAEAQYFARRIGEALLHRDLSVEHPILILSGNDIEHALLALGAMYAGIPYAPLPAEYSLASPDFSELRNICELLKPGLVFVSDGAEFERALRTGIPSNIEVVVNDNALPGTTPFADLVNTEPTGHIDAAHEHVHGNTVFKLMFIAGAAGPRGVIQTHRMWTSNQEMARHYFAFLADEHPVIVDSLPWSDSLGGNAVFGTILYNGGSLYIDSDTIHDLRVIAPTMYWSTLGGLETLLPHLRDDAKFRKHFFSRLKLLYYEGVEISQQLWDELGEAIPIVTSLSSPATAHYALLGHLSPNGQVLLNSPLPGTEIKIVPGQESNLEVRFRGPNLTFGYWRQLEQTRAAFDEEGFFRLGRNVRFADDRDPGSGLVLI